MQSKENGDVIFVASCNVDLVSYVDRMPKMGETLEGKSFKMGFGGKGANKAIACSRLGSNCAVISKLGNDIFGKDTIDNFKKNKIQTDHVFITDEAATGVAPICVDADGNNSILVILGANLLLSNNDVDKCLELVKRAKILVTNLEIPAETALYALKLAKENQLTTLFNFSPAKKDFNHELLSNTDFLFLNEVEIEQLSGLPNKTVEDIEAACLNLIEKFNVAVGVVVTLGGNGVVYMDRSTKKKIHKACPKVNVVDTSGAGDSFVGAFAHYLHKFGPTKIEKVIELANEYASLTVESLGTQSSYPYLNQLDEKFKA